MVSYDFYVDVYHGSSISEDNWDAMERDASAKLSQFKRKYTVVAPEKNSEAMAVCAMAETLDYYEILENGNVAIQEASVGSVSVAYDNSASSLDISPKAKGRELYRVACLYLDIYRGVGG